MVADNMLVWNVHGLNSIVQRNAVQDLVAVERISLVCLQETKLHVVTDFNVIQILGSGFDYVFLSVVQMRGYPACLA
jgi:exonuclease III